ncbi:acetylornithine aminotransferase, mitochondrial-like [Iris pallida]|uniref:Acetylornithine aminotransferase, mitochondrial-like n=1 Tax=Iris pallida TaxID=29817 RepID=A0AAX6GMN2_IRIPA|nr:acetylornithine aminotransferase, mitochondrial-like [Iris pallida]KAJ6841057.1 acetylornithine aminotransferase, mitochondrial-like [Iris pallida]
MLLGGRRHSLVTFYEPTVLKNVKNDMFISREEVFCPVVPLLLFKSEEEAIQMTNGTNAGFLGGKSTLAHTLENEELNLGSKSNFLSFNYKGCCLTGGDGSVVENNNIGWVL